MTPAPEYVTPMDNYLTVRTPGKTEKANKPIKKEKRNIGSRLKQVKE